MKVCQKAKPHCAAGRQHFLKVVHTMLKNKKDAGDHRFNKVAPNKVSQWAMSRHGVLWAGRSLREKAEWARAADKKAGDRTVALSDELKSLARERDLLEDQLQDNARSGPGPLTMSSASLTIADLERFHTLVNDPDFRSAGRIRNLRTRAMEAAPPISRPRLAQLATRPVWEEPKTELPPWAARLIEHRDAFAKTALAVRNQEGEEEFWLVLYMVINPPYIATCKLVEIATYTGAPQPGMACVASGNAERVFKANFAAFSTAADLPPAGINDMRVLLCMEYQGGTSLSTCWKPLPLHTYLSWQPEHVAKAREPKADHKKKQKDDNDNFEDVLMELPWLQHLETSEWAHNHDTSKAEAISSAASTDDWAGTPELEEEVVFAAIASMEAAKLAMVSEPGSRSDDFGVRMRVKSKAAASSSGDAGYDAAQAVARNALAEELCKRRGVQVSFRVSYGTGASPDQVGVLMRGWCRRMQHFFDLEITSAAGKKLVFSQQQVDEYEESTEFLHLATPLASKQILQRVQQIRNIFA